MSISFNDPFSFITLMLSGILETRRLNKMIGKSRTREVLDRLDEYRDAQRPERASFSPPFSNLVSTLRLRPVHVSVCVTMFFIQFRILQLKSEKLGKKSHKRGIKR